MNSIADLERDSFRSSVSSPGMPNTCLTPSASRHSTKTSDALRVATKILLPGYLTRRLDKQRNPGTCSGFKVARYPAKTMFRAPLTAVLLALLALPASADAATRWVVDGAGWGHGIGMSQYGAYGMARNG